MKKTEICPVCGYDPSRDAARYPALTRLEPESRLRANREEGFVLTGRDMERWAALSQTLQQQEETIRRMEARVAQLEQLLKVTQPTDFALADMPVERVKLPEGEAVLADFALADTSVSQVELPEGMKEIGQGAFSGCSKLTLVQFRRSLRRIGERAFFGCISLRQIALPKEVAVIEAETFAGCTALERVQLPTRLRRIEREAFAGCTLLRELRIPAGVEQIDPTAFAGCATLARLSLPGKMRGKPLPRLPEGCRVEYRGSFIADRKENPDGSS